MVPRQLGLGVVVTSLCGLFAMAGCEGAEGGGSNEAGAGSSGSPSGADTSAKGGSTTASSGGGSDGGTGGVELTADSYFGELLAAYCHALFVCPLPPNDDLLFVPAIYLTEQACAASLVERFERFDSTRDILKKVAAGTLSFNRENASSCLAAYASCGALKMDAISCSEVFEGTVALGGDCSRNEDCAGAAYCAVDGCPGICTERLALGRECEDSQQCDQSTGPVLCEWSETGAVCVPLAAGTAGLGSPCDEDSFDAADQCQEGLFCDRDSGLASGVCAAPIPAGGDCDDPDDVCADRLTACLVDSNGVGQCAAITLVKEAGGECRKEGVGHFSVCDPQLLLACVDSVCVQLGDGSQGSRCSNSDFFEEMCDDGLYCSEATDPPSCQPRPAVGALCDPNAESICEWGCDEESRTCTASYCQGR